MIPVADNDFFNLYRLLEDAKNWASAGHSDDAVDFLDDALCIMKQQKSSAGTELIQSSHTGIIPDPSW